MPNDELLRLAERVEAASAVEQRKMLLQAEDAISGGAISAHWNYAQHERFRQLLNANAYESAAMRLVPEGWSASFVSFPEGHAEAGVLEFQEIDGELRHAKGMADSGRVTAATPALALTAAALRARSHSGDTQ